MLHISPNDLDGLLRGTESGTFPEAVPQVTVGGDDIEGSSDNPAKPTPKRTCQDSGPNDQANKRPRTCDYAPLTGKNEYVGHIHDEGDSLESTRPDEKALLVVIAAVRDARALMFDLAPMSAKDLAFMQQDWRAHGFSSLLAKTLTTGRDYTAIMGKYFDNALDLLSLLKEEARWRAGHLKIEVDCSCQKGGAAPEHTGEVKAQHPHVRGDTTPDGSQGGKVLDRPVHFH